MNQSTNVGLRKGVSLISFIRNYEKVDVVPFTDKETGASYNRLVAYDAYDNRTFVNMSSRNEDLQNKSAEELAKYISEHAKDLQVVDTENDTKILCKSGGELKGAIRLSI